MLINIILVIVLVCIVGAIIFYLYRAKKRGEKCIGCPYAKQCGGGKCGGHGHTEKQNAGHPRT